MSFLGLGGFFWAGGSTRSTIPPTVLRQKVKSRRDSPCIKPRTIVGHHSCDWRSPSVPRRIKAMRRPDRRTNIRYVITWKYTDVKPNLGVTIANPRGLSRSQSARGLAKRFLVPNPAFSGPCPRAPVGCPFLSFLVSGHQGPSARLLPAG